MRLRIDFTVREADVPPEDARGVTFGDEIDATKIFDFFNRCRDAVVTLFHGTRPKTEADTTAELQREIDKLKAEEARREAQRKRDMTVSLPRRTGPYEARRDESGRRWAKLAGIADDGSRSGDGPPLFELNALSQRRF